MVHGKDNEKIADYPQLCPSRNYAQAVRMFSNSLCLQNHFDNSLATESLPALSAPITHLPSSNCINSGPKRSPHVLHLVQLHQFRPEALPSQFRLRSQSGLASHQSQTSPPPEILLRLFYRHRPGNMLWKRPEWGKPWFIPFFKQGLATHNALRISSVAYQRADPCKKPRSMAKKMDITVIPPRNVAGEVRPG